MTALLRQIAGALAVGLVAAITRPRHLLLAAAGFLIAGLTLVALLTVPAGLARIGGHTGLDDVALVLSKQASSEAGATFPVGVVADVATLPGIASGADGRALVAPQFVVQARLREQSGGTAPVLIRGVTPAFWRIVGAHVQLSAGRRFRPGLDQFVAGDAAVRRFVALDTGAQVRLLHAPWRSTGIFKASGMWNSELWTSMAALQSAYNAQGQVSTVWVALNSPTALNAFETALHRDPRLDSVRVVSQRTYYRNQIGFLTSFVDAAILGIAVVLGAGAVLAVFNALSLSLAARRRETAVLRALGFGRLAVALALLIEVLVVGAASAIVAIAFGYALIDGRVVGSATLGQAISFPLRLTSKIGVVIVAYLIALGFLAALLPIFRAVRAPLTKALQGE